MPVLSPVKPPPVVDRLLADRTRKMLIGGSWVESRSGKTFDVIDPTTGKVIAAVPEADRADVDAAVGAARRRSRAVVAQLPHERQG